MKKQKNENPQTKMPLKFRGIPLLQRISFKLGRYSIIFDQITFWRSPVLWLCIFVSAALPAVTIPWLYGNIDNLPPEIPFFYYYSNPDQRFISSSYLIYIIAVLVTWQLVSIFISYKLFFKMKSLSVTVLLLSSLCTIIIYAGLYKSISILLT